MAHSLQDEGKSVADLTSRSDSPLANSRKPRVLFISWAPYCSRSDNIARELGGESHMIYHNFWGSHPLSIVFKYLTQTLATLWLLLRKRPESVICMSPPVPSIASAWLYCLVFRKRYGIDYHTAAFVFRSQRAIFFLQAFFARHAAINLLTNSHLANIVNKWSGTTMLVSDVRVVYELVSPYEGLKNAFNVTFVSRFAETEPLDVVYAAARELEPEGVHIYVTGDLRDAHARDLQNQPSNVTLTDFLSVPVYAGLLRDSDVVLCLCTNDNTMQRGAYEAMSLGTPLILSDWGILRETFSRGAVFVSNTVEGVVEGVRRSKDQQHCLTRDIAIQREERFERWKTIVAQLEKALAIGDT